MLNFNYDEIKVELLMKLFIDSYNNQELQLLLNMLKIVNKNLIQAKQQQKVI